MLRWPVSVQRSSVATGNRSIPIVFAQGIDPVGVGYIDSLRLEL